MNIEPNLISNPLWASMDATARGLLIQLMLIASNNGNEIIDDESEWRRILSIPETSSLGCDGLEEHFFHEAKSRGEILANHYLSIEINWNKRWYPMIKKAWRKKPNGNFECIFLQPNNENQDNIQSTARTSLTVKKSAPKSRAKSKSKTRSPVHDLPLDYSLSSKGAIGHGLTLVHPMSERIFDRDYMRGIWHAPTTRSNRLNIWNIGAKLIADNHENEASARNFIGLMIRKYGEKSVSSAIGQLSSRSSKPANPKSFLISILQRNVGDNEKAQRARNQRADQIL